MKKVLTAFLILSLLTLAAVMTLQAVAAGQKSDAPGTVWLSGTGNDNSGNGTQTSPYLTLEKALGAVADGGTVVILDRIAPTTAFNWTEHGKSVTVTGGVLDLSAFGSNRNLNIRDNVTFTGIELTFATIDWNGDSDDKVTTKSNAMYNRTYIYANGHHLIISPDVTFTHSYNTNVWLFGGAIGGTLEGDTDLEVYAGTYTYIFGGSNGGTINGDTHLTVGGTVNPTAQVTNHKTNYNIYGGGMSCSITGSTYLTIQDNAKAIYARGGSYGSGSKIGGYINTEFKGGSLMNLSGGNGNVNTGRGAILTMTGGTVQQVFGGCTGAAFGTASAPVTVNIRILGGSVTRRIYGGCYNDYAKDSSSKYVYKSAHYVYGNIVLTMDANATVKFSGSYADQSIFACSRYGKARTGEHTAIIYTSDDAYSRFKSKLGTNDFGSSWVGLMDGVSATDETHICTYTAAGDTVTETCSYSGCNHTGTATLKMDPAVSLVYSGQPIKPAIIEYSSGWKGGNPFVLSYSGNINAGTAAVTMSDLFCSVSLDFIIEKADAAVLTVKSHETIRGKADGKINGLTTATEYSTDSITYTTVTDPDMNFAAGTYYIRFPEDANHHASGVIKLTINSGAPLRITFKAEGFPDIVKEVSWDATLTDIPAVPERTGYTDTAPIWSVKNFTHIKKDMTVNAIYTKNAPTEDTENSVGTASSAPAENKPGGCRSTFGFVSAGCLIPAILLFLFFRKKETPET